MRYTVVREAVSGTLGIAVFGTMLGIVHAPIALAAGLAVVAYAGGRLLLRNERAIEREKADDEREAFVEKGLRQAEELKALAPQVPDVALRERVQHMGVRLVQICGELREHPEKAWDASSFIDLYLPRMVEVIRNYVRLATRPGVDLEGEEFREAVDTINGIADVLKDMHHKLFRDEVAQLGIASETLRRVLEISEPDLIQHRKRETDR